MGSTHSPSRYGKGSFRSCSKIRAGGGKLAQLAAANPMLANLAGLGGSGSSSLETEVKILESPSVLKPVYDYVLSQKRKAGINVDRFTFADWLPSLKVELEKGTSVLNIAYQDTDKELVLPVAKRVSQTYQTYSGRDRSRANPRRELLGRATHQTQAPGQPIDARCSGFCPEQRPRPPRRHASRGECRLWVRVPLGRWNRAAKRLKTKSMLCNSNCLLPGLQAPPGCTSLPS